MFNRLNTSAFPQSTDFYIAEFEYVLQKITLCYKMMIDDGVKVQNSENLIRDKLLINYLKDNSISLFDVRFLFFMARNYNVSSEISSRVPAQ